MSYNASINFAAGIEFKFQVNLDLYNYQKIEVDNNNDEAYLCSGTVSNWPGFSNAISIIPALPEYGITAGILNQKLIWIRFDHMLNLDRKTVPIFEISSLKK